MAYDTILFDVDGTLCDPGKSMIESARYALEKQGIHETNDDNLRRLIGPPLEHAFRDYYGFDEARADEAVIHFREKMQKDGVQLYEPYLGTAELLAELHQAGKILAVVTSKIEHIAIETLKRTELLPYFKTVSAQQPGVVVDKEAILNKALRDLGIEDTSSVVMIGDRRHDVEAANVHGIDSIGVLWGYGSVDELENEGATYIVENMSHLRSVLKTD